MVDDPDLFVVPSTPFLMCIANPEKKKKKRNNDNDFDKNLINYKPSER